MENSSEPKLNFFSRMKIAIFKLENYGLFIEEKPSKAFKYFFLLILVNVIIITIGLTIDFNRFVSKGLDFVENNLPNFVFEENELVFDDYSEGYDEDYNFRLIVDTSDEGLKKSNEYMDKIKNAGMGLLILKDKFNLFLGDVYSREDSYESIIGETGLKISNKNDLIDMFTGANRVSITIVFFVINIFLYYLANTITILSDLIFVAVVGFFMARLCGITLKLIGSFELSIYSLTLSVILSAIYNSVRMVYPTFVIQYFNIIYLLIAYVYLIASLFMIRDDLIKQQQEIEKIKEVEEQVKKELEQEEKKEETKTEEEKQSEPKQEEKQEEPNAELEDKKEEPSKEPEDEKPDENNLQGDAEPDGSEI